jgi:hypothetical protein
LGQVDYRKLTHGCEHTIHRYKQSEANDQLNHSQCVVGQLEPERRGDAHRSDRQHKQHAHQQGYIGQRALDSNDATEDRCDVHDLEDENDADHYHQCVADNVEHEVPEGVRTLPSEVGGD